MSDAPLQISEQSIDHCLAHGLEDILAQHWQEIALDQDTTPLKVDWDSYRILERQRILRSFTAWRDGEFVGYNVFFVRPPLHYCSEVWGVNDILWLAPEERRGLTGVRLIKHVEPILQGEGVKKLIYHAKLHVNFGHGQSRGTLGRLMYRLGYLLSEEVWTKRL